MASQSKRSEMLSQFSVRDDHVKSPAPKRQKRKPNLQYSQLNVHKLEVTTTKITVDTQNVVKETQNEELIDAGWDSWSDDDDNMELYQVLSQYDRPTEEETAKKIKLTATATTSTNKAGPKTAAVPKFAVPQAAAAKQTDHQSVPKNQQKEHTQEKKDLGRDKNGNVAKTKSISPEAKVTSIARLIPPERLGARVKEELDQLDEEKAADASGSIIEFEFKFNKRLNLTSSSDTENIKTYARVMDECQNLFDELLAELQAVAFPSQENLPSDLDGYWTAKHLSSVEPWCCGERLPKIRLHLSKLSRLNKADPSTFSKANKINYHKLDPVVRSVSCSLDVERPLILPETPLLLQQICQICDLAALRHDFFSFGPITCSCIEFIATISTNQDYINRNLIFWILSRCTDIAPMPSISIFLLEAVAYILSNKPDLLQGQLSPQPDNHSSMCLIGKICNQLTIFLETNDNNREQKQPNLREYCSQMRKDCFEKRQFLVKVAIKLADLIAAVHFSPAFKLPPCLNLANLSSCLRTIFLLSARLCLTQSSKAPEGVGCELAAKFISALFWLSSAETAKFREFTSNFRAELYYFLCKQRKSDHSKTTAAAIEHLITTYSTWGNAAMSSSTESTRRPSVSSEQSSTPSSSKQFSAAVTASVENDIEVIEIPKQQHQIESANMRPVPLKKSLRLSTKVRK